MRRNDGCPWEILLVCDSKVCCFVLSQLVPNWYFGSVRGVWQCTRTKVSVRPSIWLCSHSCASCCSWALCQGASCCPMPSVSLSLHVVPRHQVVLLPRGVTAEHRWLQNRLYLGSCPLAYANIYAQILCIHRSASETLLDYRNDFFLTVNSFWLLPA